MAKFKIRVCNIRTLSDSWWEEYIKTEVTTLEEAVEWGKRTVAEWNRTEKQRYGKKAIPRKFLEAEIIDKSLRPHQWEKTNLMTVCGDGHSARDQYKCKVCGACALRYGLGNLKRTGKWKAKKYDLCTPLDR